MNECQGCGSPDLLMPTHHQLLCPLCAAGLSIENDEEE